MINTFMVPTNKELRGSYKIGIQKNIELRIYKKEEPIPMKRQNQWDW